jgi:hypothetical protein
MRPESASTSLMACPPHFIYLVDERFNCGGAASGGRTARQGARGIQLQQLLDELHHRIESVITCLSAQINQAQSGAGPQLNRKCKGKHALSDLHVGGMRARHSSIRTLTHAPDPRKGVGEERLVQPVGMPVQRGAQGSHLLRGGGRQREAVGIGQAAGAA